MRGKLRLKEIVVSSCALQQNNEIGEVILTISLNISAHFFLVESDPAPLSP